MYVATSNNTEEYKKKTICVALRIFPDDFCFFFLQRIYYLFRKCGIVSRFVTYDKSTDLLYAREINLIETRCFGSASCWLYNRACLQLSLSTPDEKFNLCLCL